MTVYLEDFREIVERLENDNKESDVYMDSLRNVDTNLSDFIFENKYSNINYFQNQFILNKLLGEELMDWVNWYFYDRPSSEDNTHNVSIGKVGYLINDLNSFMEFAQHGLQLPMKPTGV